MSQYINRELYKNEPKVKNDFSCCRTDFADSIKVLNKEIHAARDK